MSKKSSKVILCGFQNCQVYLCGTKKDIVDDNPDRRKVSTSQIVRYATGILFEFTQTGSCFITVYPNKN